MSAGQHRKQRSARHRFGWLRVLADLADSAGLVARATADGVPALDTVPWPTRKAIPAPVAALREPATITHAAVPPTVADIDPGRGPLELAASTWSAESAVAALHTAHPGLPTEMVKWTHLDDGAHGEVSQNPHISDEERRDAVIAYARVLGVDWDEQDRGDGFVICSVAAASGGARIGVEAITCRRDIDERLAVFEAAMADPSLDGPPTEHLPLVRAPLALPAAAEAP